MLLIVPSGIETYELPLMTLRKFELLIVPSGIETHLPQ